MAAQVLKPEEYFITEQPYYEAIGNEIEVFEAAYQNQLPVLLKGPTGCGKTRFMEHMAWRLERPLITVSCHDDLTASDLVGRFLISGGETEWVDGPLARAVRSGGICYLDEIVEASPGPLPQEQVVDWALQICDVLSYLHNHDKGGQCCEANSYRENQWPQKTKTGGECFYQYTSRLVHGIDLCVVRQGVERKTTCHHHENRITTKNHPKV